jgi:hypothetical protein
MPATSSGALEAILSEVCALEKEWLDGSELGKEGPRMRCEVICQARSAGTCCESREGATATCTFLNYAWTTNTISLATERC